MHERTKINMEVEKDSQLAFLDVMIKKNVDGYRILCMKLADNNNSQKKIKTIQTVIRRMDI